MSSDACKSARALVEAHLDAQLDAVQSLEVEQHLDACEECRERVALQRAMRGTLKKAVQTTAPSDVRARMLAAMAGESAREQARDDAAKMPRPSMLRHWRTMVPIASAAAMAIAWGAAGNQPVPRANADLMRAGFGNDDLVRDLVGLHSKALPPEQTDPQQLSRYVGVPVRPPQLKNARFVGSRLVTLRDAETAAMLQYEIGNGQRVTIFVYNPRSVQVGGANLAPRAIGTAEVRVGQENGYNVGVTQHAGVGYTVASDLPQDESVKLLAVVDHD